MNNSFSGLCRKISIVLCVALIASLFLGTVPAMADEKIPQRFAQDAYDAYLQKYFEEPSGADSIVCKAEDSISSDIKMVGNYRNSGKTALLVTRDKKAEWSFTVETSGMYDITVNYYSAAGESASKTEISISVDRAFIAEEFQNLILEDIYFYDTENVIEDIYGNSLRPSGEKLEGWYDKQIFDQNGYISEPLSVYLSEGEHSIALHSVGDIAVVSQIELSGVSALMDYSEQLKLWQSEGAKPAGKSGKTIEAENTLAVSSQSIIPLNDRTSPMTSPSDAYRVKYNTLGSENWKTVGEWVEWEVTVPESGLYALELRFKQDQKKNDMSHRKIYIDGELPFLQAAGIAFPYDSGWQKVRVGDGNSEYLFYLTEGTHTIRMEATFGNNAQLLKQVSALIDELNSIYLDIIVITGVAPDVNRDYNFEKIIPDTLKQLADICERLKELEKELTKISGGGQNTAIIKQNYIQIEKIVDEPSSLSKRLSAYKNNITSLASWLQDSMEQPLEIDTLSFVAPNSKIGKGEASFFQTVLFRLKQLLFSYVYDYNNVGKLYENATSEIRVWMGTSGTSGRDQSQTVQQLCHSFTKESGIGVSVQLVSPGALLPAIFAQRGPDVVLGLAQNEPVNYALRNALEPLNEKEGIEELLKEFNDAALVPFSLDGKLYAIPETESYPMMFVRTDVLEKLDLSLSQLDTWESVFQVVLPTLQNNYLNFGIPVDIKMYAMLLYQNGGKMYSEDHTVTEMNSIEGVAAFKTYTEFYTDYKQSLAYDFANRFRTGELPIAIAEYTSYNQLSVFAPEIKGKWTMTAVPGTEREDGTVDRSAPVTVTGAAILAASDKIDEAWGFLRWWSSCETQTEFAVRLEAILGTAGRYAPANQHSFENIPWDNRSREGLKKQAEETFAIPEIPGGYFMARNFQFAFRDVVYSGCDVREALSSAERDINVEIKNKREEFYN